MLSADWAIVDGPGCQPKAVIELSRKIKRSLVRMVCPVESRMPMKDNSMRDEINVPRVTNPSPQRRRDAQRSAGKPKTKPGIHRKGRNGRKGKAQTNV